MRVLVPLTAAAMLLAIWTNWAAPLEGGSVMTVVGRGYLFEGLVQKVLYVHAPAAWSSYIAVAVTFVASIGFLVNKRRSWDQVAVSSAEVGVVFCTLVLLTGPLWAKAIWGVYWQWDARLSSFLVFWFMFVGYLVVRMLATDREQGARWSAVVAIIGALDMPIVHWSVNWWTTLHPPPKALTSGGLDRGLAPGMGTALWTGMLAFTFLYLLLFFLRLDLEKLSDRVEAAGGS
jgi:heme exporter protein C